MIQFTGWQYLMIDCANAFGHDKLLFEDRIQWTEDNLENLETLADQAETKPLYMKAVMAIRKVQQGKPTGHMVGFDAICSGVQVMSALTGCIEGAKNTGLIDTGTRPDAYTACTKEMNKILGGGLSVARKDAKQALMTAFYGSKKTPKEIFGENTPELNAFYQAAAIVAPGAWELLQDLLASWQPYALVHEWKLPDGYDARVKVMQRKSTRIEVDELDHATFTYEYYENEGTKKGLSNAANVVHSVDAYVLRCIHRRCNYDPLTLHFAMENLAAELAERKEHGHEFHVDREDIKDTKLEYYIQQYERTGMADVVILPYLLNESDCWYLSSKHIEKLIRICDRMKSHKPFSVVTVHDEFKCSPGNMNQLRQHYIDIFVELSESDVLADILSQIHGIKCSCQKLSSNLGSMIRGGSYALC